MYIKKFIFSLLFFCIIPFYTHAENAGFVQGLWYSDEPVFTGIPTRIYAALRNNTEHDLTATVRFTDNGKRIGSSEIHVLSGRLIEVWTDWTPTSGEHKIEAQVTDATLHPIGEDTQSIAVTQILAEDTLTVDTDTDGDGIGNTTDTDDDNDTIIDTEEKNRGSNPLVKNPTTHTSNEAPAPETDTVTSSPESSITHNTERGLEQYVDEGITDSLLTNITKKVELAKEAIDTYREKNTTTTPHTTDLKSIETKLGTYTDHATITRSKIEPEENFLHSLYSSAIILLKKVWMFVLFIVSNALAFPALIELGILIGILYIIYRIARSVGRRPNR